MFLKIFSEKKYIPIEPMVLSIIIVTYNSRNIIHSCLQSILPQVAEMQHELIIVDNVSVDGSYEFVKANYPQAVLIQSEKNVGFAAGNNLGLRIAKGEFVLLINPDTIWKKGKIANAIQFIRDRKNVGALGCRLVFPNGKWQRSYGNYPTLCRELKETFYIPRFFPWFHLVNGIFGYLDKEEPISVDWIPGTFFLCRRSDVANIGYFDKNYFLYYEDIDLSKKLRDSGKEIYYFPYIEVIHDTRWSSTIDYGESPYIYFCKHYSVRSAKWLRFILLFKTILRSIIFSPFALFPIKLEFQGKSKSYYRTFKYHLFHGSEVIENFMKSE